MTIFFLLMLILADALVLECYYCSKKLNVAVFLSLGVLFSPLDRFPFRLRTVDPSGALFVHLAEDDGDATQKVKQGSVVGSPMTSDSCAPLARHLMFFYADPETNWASPSSRKKKTVAGDCE